MGLFDGRNVSNSFDRLFDLNRDGILDQKEQIFQMSYIGGLLESENSSGCDDVDDFGDDFDDDDFSDDDF